MMSFRSTCSSSCIIVSLIKLALKNVYCIHTYVLSTEKSNKNMYRVRQTGMQIYSRNHDFVAVVDDLFTNHDDSQLQCQLSQTPALVCTLHVHAVTQALTNHWQLQNGAVKTRVSVSIL